MSRILVVVPPLTGHINPTVPLGLELTARGHEVAWAGLPGVVDVLLPEGATFLPIVGALDRAAFEAMQQRSQGLRGPEALKFLWEGFIIPYAMSTGPELLDAARAFAPDVMVVDQQAVAGAVVARQIGVPWATSATTSAELTDPLAAMPKVDAWVREQLVDLQLELGVDPAIVLQGDLRFSNHLIIAFTSAALFGPMAKPDPSIHFVGPSITDRPETAPFPWAWLEPGRPHVLVSLGTVNASMGARFFATAVEAIAGTDIQAVVVAPPDQVALPPGTDNIVVLERVPQLALLGRLDAVVSHGGHNTVCETLAHGLPLVLAPIRDDQPIVADQVARAGAGRRVKFGRVRPDELLEAIRTVLVDPSYRQAAATIQASFRDAGGAPAAADALEALLPVKEPA